MLLYLDGTVVQDSFRGLVVVTFLKVDDSGMHVVNYGFKLSILVPIM